MRAAPRRGFTLLEALIALTILAILSGMALPSFSQRLAQARLDHAAGTLQADLGFARQRAIERDRPVHVRFQPGARWCYAITWDQPAADCSSIEPTDASLLKLVQSDPGSDVTLLTGQPMALGPATAATLTWPTATFGNPRGDRRTLRLGPTGRASITKD